jgi:hypothetical protein
MAKGPRAPKESDFIEKGLKKMLAKKEKDVEEDDEDYNDDSEDSDDEEIEEED